MNTYLQIFLYADVFIMGVVAAVAVRHGLAHFFPHEPEKPHSRISQQDGHLPKEIREQLIDSEKSKFEATVEHSAQQLQHDLTATEERLTKQLEKLGQDIVDKEMARFHAELDKLHQQTEATTKAADTDIEQHQKELKAKLEEELAAEKQQLLQQIDTKLGDAAISFLIETLQHNVDLGAQSEYLMSKLEEHKAELKQEVTNDA